MGMISQQQMQSPARGGEADASFKPPGNHVEKVEYRIRNFTVWSGARS